MICLFVRRRLWGPKSGLARAVSQSGYIRGLGLSRLVSGSLGLACTSLALRWGSISSRTIKYLARRFTCRQVSGGQVPNT